MNKGFIDFSQVKRILVAKLRHHGDVLLSSPVFSLLKRRVPHASIDAYIYLDTYPMLEGHPAIDHFLCYDKRWKKLPFYQRLLKEAFLLRRIRRGKYDLVINLTEGDRGAIAAKLSKARYAIGFDPEGGGMAKKKGLYTHLVKHTPRPRHTVEKQLDALRVLGIFPSVAERELFFHIPKEATSQVKQLLAKERILPGEFIQIHPVSRWMFKTVPAQCMAEVILALHSKGKRVVLTASSDVEEKRMNEEIKTLLPHVPICDLSGRTTLKELGAITQLSEALITVDSVSLHIASALKKPVVAIFGPSCDQNWGPWKNPHSRVVRQDFSCRPCYQPGCGGSGKSDCLETLPSEKIIEAVFELL